MNAQQFALRNAAFNRDCKTIDALYAAGADAMHAVRREVAHLGDPLLLEILLCADAGRAGMETAQAIERGIRADDPVVATYLRVAFLKKIVADIHLGRTDLADAACL